MINNREFLKCSVCGNVASLVDSKGPKLVCCDHEMAVLKPNTTDAAAEKHVPVAELSDGVLHVKVGNVPHPHTPEHHISWIAVAQGPLTQRLALPQEEEATASFVLTKNEPVTVYAYCNLHGLWAAEV